MPFMHQQPDKLRSENSSNKQLCAQEMATTTKTDVIANLIPTPSPKLN